MDEAQPRRTDRLTLILRWSLGIVAGLVVLAGALLGYAYLATPAALRHPTPAHFHFRLQIINNGRPVDFSANEYQSAFNQDVCTAKLTKEPVHFHDRLDQFVHVHWKHVTGGVVLKNYGWNFIGGTKFTLGYRFDQLPRVVHLPVHSRSLPNPSPGARYFVYVSSMATPSTVYQQRSWDSFLEADLEDFFKAAPAARTTSWLGTLVPTASAHNGEEELASLNDVLGNVVIFAQKTAPTDAQIKDRFSQLVPLPLSACGG